MRSASIELLGRTNWIQFALPAVWGANRQLSLAGVARDLTGRARIAIGAPPVLLEQSQAVGNEIILDNLPIGARDATRGFSGAWCNAVRLSSFALSRELVERSKGEWASTSSARTANRTVLAPDHPCRAFTV